VIDIKKQYRTRCGREVRIYATDGVGKKSVHGAYFDDHVKGWISLVWTKFGRADAYHELQPLDLIEVRPRHKRTLWVTVWSNGYTETSTKPEWRNGPLGCGEEPIACIKVELDFEEGEGL
jgi:hypothetical protein